MAALLDGVAIVVLAADGVLPAGQRGALARQLSAPAATAARCSYRWAPGPHRTCICGLRARVPALGLSAVRANGQGMRATAPYPSGRATSASSAGSLLCHSGSVTSPGSTSSKPSNQVRISAWSRG